MTRILSLSSLTGVVLLFPAATPVMAQARAGADSALLQRMLSAEDGRRRDPMGIAVLEQGLRSPDSAIRRVAVRALGRLEASANYTAIARLLADSAAMVRAEAVTALGQIVPAPTRSSDAGARDGLGAAQVRDVLVAHLATERNGAVRGVIARTLGRLPYTSPGDAETAARAIAGVKAAWPEPWTPGAAADGAAIGLATWESTDTLALAAWRDIAHGLESLFRRNPTLRIQVLVPPLPAPRLEPRTHRSTGRADTLVRDIRSILALVRGRALGQHAAASGAAAMEELVLGRTTHDDLEDPDPWVRRVAVALVSSVAALSDAARAPMLASALADSSPAVRLEAVRGLGRRPLADCAPLLGATRDRNPHVALAAIDALGTACANSPVVADSLARLIARIPTSATRPRERGSWHYGAHAIVALARVDPGRARAEAHRLAGHPVWQVRMYAARAAAVAEDGVRLLQFGADPSSNVREAAVDGLTRMLGRGDSSAARGAAADFERDADSVFIAQLGRPDYQLVLTAARALRRTPTPARAIGPLLASLDRLTGERRETSRDPRMEVLARIAEMGSAEHAPRLEQYLTDFDPVVAVRAAHILRGWGRSEAVAAPRPLAPAPVSLAELARGGERRLRITMAPASGGGSFEVRLLPGDAPATVARFVGLATRGYYHGLTFHRVAPNFVIQGGSPGANEYMGDGPYMRDELGLRSHTRGTLGISTRGRDTGDAQIFVNLADNWRLDHDYTVFAEVVRGMDVVDGILEGDVIQRVEVSSGLKPAR